MAFFMSKIPYFYEMIYTFENQQFIKSDLQTVWKYFNNPKHIQALTPPKMQLKTRTQNLPNQIHKNLNISYWVSPLFGIPISWKTEIISVEENKSFIDIQIKGPYKKWHHLHTLEEVENGILMKDFVTYELPLGFIGSFIHEILVKKEIENLFKFRTKQIQKHFENE